MEKLEKYIEFRYNNWLDYAIQMAKVHKFVGWEKDLLNECLIELLKKDHDLLSGLLARKTQKIVNGQPTTELDKYILKIMHLNAFSPVAPFRKNTLGNKIITREDKKVITRQNTQLNGIGNVLVDTGYNLASNDKLDHMHTHNLKRMSNNGFCKNALTLYNSHFIRGRPLKEYPATEKEYISEINQFLTITKKTLFDD
jgi:hypothetical protein